MIRLDVTIKFLKSLLILDAAVLNSGQSLAISSKVLSNVALASCQNSSKGLLLFIVSTCSEHSKQICKNMLIIILIIWKEMHHILTLMKLHHKFWTSSLQVAVWDYVSSYEHKHGVVESLKQPSYLRMMIKLY